MTRLLFTFLSLLVLGTAVAGEGDKEKKKKIKKPKLEHGIYAQFTTSKGIIICQLEYEKTPMTVANFVGLAEGDFSVDSFSYNKPFYDGVKFHRVINNFMIQGGDPLGTGSGGPEHRFFDETRKDLTHSSAGILSMANSDPQRSKAPYSNTGMTNGSQFFITHKETPHLDGLHTVFGHVIFGQDVVNSIVQDDVIEKVKIIRKGKTAKKWNASEAFAKGMKEAKENVRKQMEVQAVQIEESGDLETAKRAYQACSTMFPEDEGYKNKVIELDEKIQKEAAELKAYTDKVSKMSQEDFDVYMYQEILKKHPRAQRTKSGLVYILENPGGREKPVKGSKMSVHYRGTFRTSGKQFDASYDRGKPMDFTYKVNRMVAGFEEGLSMLGEGGKAKIFIPYYAAYGASGRPPRIPAYSDLVFDLEIVSLKQPAPEEHTHDHDGHGHHDHDGHDHNHKH